MKPLAIVGLDPGLSSVGYAELVYLEGKFQPIVLDVFRSSKNKHGKVTSSEDNLSRAQDLSVWLSRYLRSALENYTLLSLCVESMSFPPSSSAAAKMAMCWGVLGAWSSYYNIPVVQIPPQDVKKYATGTKSASKLEVETKARALYGDSVDKSMTAHMVKVKSIHEHAFDALMVGVVGSLKDSIRSTVILYESTQRGDK